MFDLGRIARITAGEFSGKRANCALSGISTDSRNMTEGALFVPLRGVRFDGHDYLSQAVKNGAAACLSEEIVAGLPVPVVRVPDTLRALGDIAAAYRMQLSGPLVAITGSAGKTTTKEMLAGILARVAPGLKTAGNFNNLIGLPLTLLRLEPKHQWAVLEMGTSSLGEIERLTEIAQPSCGLITNIGAAHLAGLHGLEGVARAKGELFAGLRGGMALVNLDDPRVAALPVANGVKRITYGETGEAEVRAENIAADEGKVGFDLVWAEQRQRVQLQVAGRHHLHNALAAAAVALELTVPAAEIAAGLAAFAPVQGRMELAPLPCGGVLLDDSYNSNPLSAAAALEALAGLKGKGRRVAILGDMLELGKEAAELHRAIGAKAAANVDLLVAVGDFAEALCAGAGTAGMPRERAIAFAGVAQALEFLQQEQRSGDRILVKGSRGMQLERVVAALLQAAETTSGKQGG